jgi:putative photosynthetic complex assembly protein
VAESFPKLPLYTAWSLVAFALIGATTGRLTGLGAQQPLSSPISSRLLRFEDRADGAVVIYDATLNPTDVNATPVAVATGQNGFLRGVLRGFARTRKADQVGPLAPFRLTAWQDGRLTLEDPATGRHSDLEAFGQTQVAAFARFLIPPTRMAANASPTP